MTAHYGNRRKPVGRRGGPAGAPKGHLEASWQGGCRLPSIRRAQSRGERTPSTLLKRSPLPKGHSPTLNGPSRYTNVMHWLTTDGQEVHVEQVAVQRWRDGKIVHERFYYDSGS